MLDIFRKNKGPGKPRKHTLVNMCLCTFGDRFTKLVIRLQLKAPSVVCIRALCSGSTDEIINMLWETVIIGKSNQNFVRFVRKGIVIKTLRVWIPVIFFCVPGI